MKNKGTIDIIREESSGKKFNIGSLRLKKNQTQEDQNEPLRLRNGAAVTEDFAKKILDKFSDKIKDRTGIDVSNVSKIGSGSQGVAFSTGKVVVKVTADAKEARACYKLKGYDSEYLVKIGDVFQIDQSGSFCIIQEHLTPISGSDGKEFDDSLKKTKFHNLLPFASYDLDNLISAMKEYFNLEVKKRFKDDTDSNEAKEYYQSFVDAWGVLKNKFHIDKIHQSLMDVGIHFHDYHSGNLMMRGNEYVLIDPGLSKVTNGEDPPILESMKKNNRLTESRIRFIVNEEIEYELIRRMICEVIESDVDEIKTGIHVDQQSSDDVSVIRQGLLNLQNAHDHDEVMSIIKSIKGPVMKASENDRRIAGMKVDLMSLYRGQITPGKKEYFDVLRSIASRLPKRSKND